MPPAPADPATGASERTTEPLVEAKALTKRFGSRVAVDGIDFEVRAGEAFGFLAPTGPARRPRCA